MATLFADFILIIHFLFVLFVVGGLALIWIGVAWGWFWVRNYWFRIAHLVAIAYVAVEAVLGVVCPLTAWEDALRATHDQTSFVARLIRRVLFYNFPEWVFTVAYLIFALAVALTLWLVPPRRRAKT